LSGPSLKELIQAWSSVDAGLLQEEIDRRILGFTALVRAIAERGRATPSAFAAETGISPDEVPKLFRWLAAGGLQLDDEGNVVGAALSVRATPHRFHVRGRGLYAWCALDTLFLPGLLNETAEVQSTCPVSGEEIRLTIAPDGVESYSPEGTVLSVVVPQALGSDQKTGPEGST
jgi:alkylmercury lyase